MGQLDEVSEAIGQLRSSIAALQQQMEPVRHIPAMKAAIDEMRPHVEEYQRLRAKGAGVLLGVGLVAGTVGGKLAPYLEKLFK